MLRAKPDRLAFGPSARFARGIARARLGVGVLALLLCCACGNDGSSVDAAVPDAGIDAEVPDGTAVDRCVTLCTCASNNCPVQFPDMATCMTDCAGLEDSVKSCRIEHCGYAQTNPGLHCPHVEGDPTSPGVPAACLSN